MERGVPSEHGGVVGQAVIPLQDLLEIQTRAMAVVSSGLTIADATQKDFPLIYCNQAFSEMTGYSSEEVMGRNCRFLQGPETDRSMVATIRQALPRGESCTVTLKNYRKDGTTFWNELTLTPVHDLAGRVTHFVGVQHDITARKEAQEALAQARLDLELKVQERTAELEQANARLAYDALHDALTGLPNRVLLLNRLEHAFAKDARAVDKAFAVLYLDLDGFKAVNDSLGHDVGDALLKVVAERLKCVMRPSDTVARFGGDEFVILLEELEAPARAILVAERIQRMLSQSFILGDNTMSISASIGIVLETGFYQSVKDIVRDADFAMYQAKASGKASYVVFDSAKHARDLSTRALATDLHEALHHHDLSVEYQPIVSAQDGSVVSFEALARWHHPQHGDIAPSSFIAVAESSGLVIALDRYVMREACQQAVRWQQQFPRLQAAMNVNLSSKQFFRADLIQFLQDTLTETGLAAQQLRLELTETVLLLPTLTVTETLQKLKALGVQLHIDDFGTGYASFNYLQHVPSSTLKIDRSFTKGVGQEGGGELVRTMILMAHTLGMSTVAEGVESREQLEVLSGFNCDYVQGYFLSRPMKREVATAFLEGMMT